MTSYIDLHAHSQFTDSQFICVLNCMPESVAPEGFFTVGLHPWFVREEALDRDMERLKQLSLLPNCVAIGEAGLDARKGAAMEWQILAWKKQIEWSVETNKSLIVHSVGTIHEIVYWSKKYPNHPWWILHDYHGNRVQTRDLLRHRIAFSLGPRLLDPRQAELDWWQVISRDRLFFETDDSGLFVGEVYLRASQLYRVEEESLRKQVMQNFKHCIYGGELA